MRFGPFYLTPSIPLVEMGFDSNVFNTPIDPRSDVTATAAPRVDLWVPMARRALISTSLAAEFVYFKEIDSERSVNPAADVRGDLFSRYATFFAERSYLRTRQRANFEIDTRSQRVAVVNRAGVVLAPGSRLSLEMAAFQGTQRYDRDEEFRGANLGEALNREEAGVQLLLRQRLTSFTTLLFSAAGQRDRFDTSSDRNSDSLSVTSGFEFNPRALIAGRAEVGLRQFKTRNAELPDSTGLVASVGITYTLLGATQFGLTWDRDVSYSYQPDQPYYVGNTVGFTVRRQVRGRVDASAGVQRTTYDYKSFSDVPSAGRTDRTYSYSADLGYRLNRNLRLALGATRLERRSPADPARGYDATRVALSMAYQLPG